MNIDLARKSAKFAAIALSLGITSPALAAQVLTAPSCSVVTFNVTTVNCLGFFSGNLITDSGPKLTEALGYVDDLNPAATSLIEKFDIASGHDADPINFITPLSGQTVIGLHFGGGSTGYNGTAFWLLDVPTNTDAITWSSSVESGISNAGLYYTQPGGGGGLPAVPEPATWAMMLVGFGAIGLAMRRKQRQTVNYNFA